jgi:hypothetical protein
MEQYYMVAVYLLQGGLFLAITLGLLHHVLRNYTGKVENVKAKPVDKYFNTYYRYSRLQGATPKTDYIIVFDVGGKTKRFQVSPFVYDSIQKGENGALKYKGSRFIEFE